MTHILTDHTDTQPIYLHLDNELLVGNNNDKPIAEGPDEPGYKEYFKYTLASDFFNPAATNLARGGHDIHWNGDDAKKPEKSRLWEINIKQLQDTGMVDIGHETFVIVESADGLKPMSSPDATMICEQWTEKLNN